MSYPDKLPRGLRLDISEYSPGKFAGWVFTGLWTQVCIAEGEGRTADEAARNTVTDYYRRQEAEARHREVASSYES